MRSGRSFAAVVAVFNLAVGLHDGSRLGREGTVAACRRSLEPHMDGRRWSGQGGRAPKLRSGLLKRTLHGGLVVDRLRAAGPPSAPGDGHGSLARCVRSGGGERVRCSRQPAARKGLALGTCLIGKCVVI